MSQFPHILFPLPYRCNEEARSWLKASVLFLPSFQIIIKRERERDLAAYWWGRELCLLNFTGTGAWSRKADVCGLPEKSLTDPCAVWVRGAETRRGKAGMTDTRAKAWAPAMPIAGSGSRRGLSIRQDWCTEHSRGFVYSVWFLPFHAEHEEQAEVNCLGGSWLCLFLCCVSPLLFFGWLQNLKSKDDWNASPLGGGSRAHRTPSSGSASHCQWEGNAAEAGGRGGGGGLLQLRPWAS